MKPTHGFTLFELVVAMIIISVGFLGLARMFGDSIAPMVSAEDEQRSAQYAQECIEKILADRRSLGYSSATTSSCDGLSSMATGFSRSVATTSITGDATSACPNGISCKTMTVTVSKGSVSATPTVLLVNY